MWWSHCLCCCCCYCFVDVVVVAVVVGCGVKGKRLERRVRGVYGNMWWRPSATVACIHRRAGGDTMQESIQTPFDDEENHVVW